MGHCANKFAILQDRAAAHALDNAAGGIDQLGIRYGDEQLPTIGSTCADLQNFNVILPDGVPIHIGADGCRTGVDLIRVRYRQRLSHLFRQFTGREGTENTAVGIGVQVTQIAGKVKISPQLTGFACCALFHRLHRGGQDGAGGEGHQQRRVAVRDAVAQCAEGTAVWIIIGHGADAGHGVPDPGTDGILPLVILFRRNGQCHSLCAPPDLEVRRGLTGVLQQGLELLRGGHRNAAALDDDVTGLQSALPGR